MTHLYDDSDDEINTSSKILASKKIPSKMGMKEFVNTINPVVSSFADESKGGLKSSFQSSFIIDSSSDDDERVIVNEKVDVEETKLPPSAVKDDLQDDSLALFLKKFQSPSLTKTVHKQSVEDDDFMETAANVTYQPSILKLAFKKRNRDKSENDCMVTSENKSKKKRVLQDGTSLKNAGAMDEEEEEEEFGVITQEAMKPCIPTHQPSRPCLPMELVDTEKTGTVTACVPGSISRYLKPYQVAGIQWLWSKYCKKEGCILADDMGLGKTIQIIALIAAVQGKSGLEETDIPNNRCRKKGVTGELDGGAVPYLPCLVVCPKSVIGNWKKELDVWGYFLVDMLDCSGGGGRVRSPEAVLVMAESRQTDVVVCTYNSLAKHQEALAGISWAVVAFDEGHELKNDKSKRFSAAVSLERCRLRVILTGTPVQNTIQELWSLLAVVSAGRLTDRKTFKSYFVDPILQSKSTTASAVAKELGRKRQKELIETVVNKRVLRRMKEDVLGDQLKGKDDMIVFCELSPLQTALYKHLLSLPDFDNDRYSTTPCPCGSGGKRGQCCRQEYKVPYTRTVSGDGSPSYTDKVDPRAVLWRLMHRTPGEEDTPCARCPNCVTFACLSKLLKCVAHPALLQAEPTPYPKGHVKYEADMDVYRFATEALSPDLLSLLGGPRRSTALLQSDRLDSSGKLTTLDKLLRTFTSRMHKTLVFSQSTQMLDIIEAYVKSNGWSFSRLDGSTQESSRQKLVNAFNSDRTILIFLLSTKAGGLGLNLTSSCKVVIFDCHWNPSYDLQAQDRAYRIGQNERVSVYRLVAQGTVEEVTYMRQLYKQSLQQATTEDTGDDTGQFEGIQGDAQCHGELFGIENLLQHEEGGSILARLRRKYLGQEPETVGGIGELSSMKYAEAGKLVGRAQEEAEEEAEEEEALLDIATHRNTDLRSVPLSKAPAAASSTPVSVLSAAIASSGSSAVVPEVTPSSSTANKDGDVVGDVTAAPLPKKRSLPPSMASSTPSPSIKLHIPNYS